MSKFSFRHAIGFSCSAALIVMTFQNCADFKVLSDFASEGLNGSALIGAGSKVNPFICTAGTKSRDQVRRLTKLEIDRTLLSMIGANAHARVVDSLGALYADTLNKSVTEFSHQIDDAQMNGYETLAEKIRSEVSANSSLVRDMGFDCATTSALSTECRDRVIRELGLRAFRRPLKAAETTLFRDQIIPMGSTASEQVGWLLYSIVLSPQFLLHVEEGMAETSDTTYDLSPYEVASRLSFAITDGPPDRELYAAAEAGRLKTLADLRSHVDRLFETSLAKEKIRRFFKFWVVPVEIADGSLNNDFKAGVDVVSTNREFIREMNEFIDYTVFTQKGTLEDLMLSREVFPRTDTAASILGASRVTGQNPSQSGAQRVGLFMRPNVLATDGNETHPIVRGAKFRLRFLCETMGLPQGLALAGDVSFSSAEAKALHSTRTRTEKLTGTPACMSCHSRINPVGFAFENLDNLGRVRFREKAYSTTGAVIAEHAIDSSSTFMIDPSESARSIRDGVDLMTVLAGKNQLPACFAKQILRFYQLRNESAEDNCVLNEMYDKSSIAPNASVLETFKAQLLNPAVFKRRAH